MRLTDLSLEELADVARNDADKDVRKMADMLLKYRVYCVSRDKLIRLLKLEPNK